jgi:hypothetical protein
MVKRRIQSPLNEEFEQLAQATLEKWHVPGISVAVVDGDYTWAEVSLSIMYLSNLRTIY